MPFGPSQFRRKASWSSSQISATASKLGAVRLRVGVELDVPLHTQGRDALGIEDRRVDLAVVALEFFAAEMRQPSHAEIDFEHDSFVLSPRLDPFPTLTPIRRRQPQLDSTIDS
jgi:hypothetical protein